MRELTKEELAQIAAAKERVALAALSTIDTIRAATTAMRALASSVAEFNLQLMLASPRRVEHARRRALKAIAKTSIRAKT